MNYTPEPGFREIFENSGSILLVVEPKSGQIVDANPAAVSFYGYTRNDLISMTLNQINVLEWEEIALERKRAVFPRRNFFRFRHRLATDEERDVGIFFSPIDSGSGETPLLFSIVHDITGVNRAQEELRNSEAIYRATFQTINDAVSISRLHDGMFIDVSHAFLKMMGYDREDVIGRTSIELNIWPTVDERNRFLAALQTDPTFSDLEFEFRKKSGETFLGHVSVSRVKIDDDEYFLIVTKDVSAARKAEERIRHLAFFDPLTELPNRSLLMDRIEQAQVACPRNGSSLTLLVIDLDNFKALNETLGWKIGNAVLRECGQRLSKYSHDTDTVARLGPDEFAVMTLGSSESAEETATLAKNTADRILAAIQSEFVIENCGYLITACIGIKILEHPVKDAAGFLNRAEIALHQAKAKGRGAIHFFSPALQDAVNTRISMEEDLRTAIKKEQFVLLYQPQVDNDGLAGAEALIRWNHPTRGLLGPLDFIPLAEETGMILPIGKWVLEEACRQIAKWEGREGLCDMSVAANISAQQFGQPEFVDEVLATLRMTGARPSKLKLEVTETMMMTDLDQVVAKMDLLKSYGLTFSMDDFGTGYSALASLKRLPLDQLKIDRAFVRDILADVASGAIAQTVISLGRTMGLSVIAEGVESEEQKDFLNGLGCHCFQGYLFSQPLAVNEFAAWCEEFTKRSTRKTR